MVSVMQELENTTATDIRVAGPGDYVDGGQELLAEGSYDFELVDFERDTTRDGELSNSYSLTFKDLTSGRYARRLRVWATPYLRKGVKVSGLGDFLRAIDDQEEWATSDDAEQNYRNAERLMAKAVDQKIPLRRTRVIWEAFDKAHYDALGGDQMIRKSPEQKEARRAATVKYMRNFRQTPSGDYLPEITGPSGNMLEARLVIDSFTPSSKQRR